MPADLPPAGVVRYGQASLSDLLPAALGALGVSGSANALGLQPARCVVVLLIDGLGWNLLQAHRDDAPFLAALSGTPLTAGFPTTTAASIASLGTGLPSGQHGLTGYTSRVPDFPEGPGALSEPINWLRWRGAYSGNNLLDRVVPEQAQPQLTAFEQAAAAGVEVTVVSSYVFRDSGLTRAVLRGGTYSPVLTAADTATAVAAAARSAERSLIYCYNGDLDLVGHGHGSGSDTWRVQLALIDRAAELLAERLPDDARLLITADHGMVNVPDAAKVDFDDIPELGRHVEMIAGEARVRYLHVRPEHLDEVRRSWTDRLADGFAVLRRDEVIERGWFGPVVTDTAAGRLGDLIVLATGDGAVVRSRFEERLTRMRGHHGALTDDELLVPLLQN
jgi:hypothetical protein